MRRFATMTLAMAAVVAAGLATSAYADISVGGGLHYLYAIEDIDTQNPDLSKNSFGVIGSLQWNGPMLTIEGDVEYIFDYIGTEEGLWEPSAYALLGNFIYGGAGIGVGNFDSEWTEPWYALRAGVNIPLSAMKLDVFATYRFWSDDDLKTLTGEDLNSATLAAVLRF